MQLGALFPTTEIGTDPVVIRDYAQAVEALGYDHIALYDHVLGADLTKYPGDQRIFDIKQPLHEPVTLMAFLAGVTQRVGLVTSILILPQRQTALVAKQAAEIDLLSNGRLRLGVGIGWNPAEYEALGLDFHTRGARMEEQAALLRALWTQETVNFEGKWHRVINQGLNPLPVQRPIPLWMGGAADAVLRRIARLADGWFPQMRPDDSARQALEQLRGYAREAGREPSAIGIEARVLAGRRGPEDWAKTYHDWEALGATHCSMNTMGPIFDTVDQHIDVLRRFKEAVR
ncbi:MAG: LLM class F420-dependent oxidoreductase [Chloroflexi bacterium]|nr:LLM class F420-dependent oxidoreductase [Chloroflexota bacterium]